MPLFLGISPPSEKQNAVGNILHEVRKGNVDLRKTGAIQEVEQRDAERMKSFFREHEQIHKGHN